MAEMEIERAAMLDDIRDVLSCLGCYAEVRLEYRSDVRVDATGDTLILETREERGGYVRAYPGGMWQFDSFVGFSSVLGRLRLLAAYTQRLTNRSQPRSGGVGAYNQKPIRFQQPQMAKPVNTQEIRDWLSDSVRRAGCLPAIKQARVCFVYQLVRSTFLNTEGSLIQQEKACCDALATYVVLKRDLSTHVFRFNNADAPQYSQLTNWILECATKATCLSSAKPVRPGRYTILLHPSATGALVHELVGHLQEADNISSSLQVWAGKQVGIEALNIVDDGTLTGMPGAYFYDDEGLPSTRTYLVKGGKLAGRLHSRQTACRWHETPTGNARTASYRHPPLPRMSCTFVEPVAPACRHLIDSIEEGLYLHGMRNGTAYGSRYAFAPEEAYKIEHGRIIEPLSDVVMAGDIGKMLRSIEVIGDDFGWATGAGCAKSGQYLPTISWGGPHIILANVAIGGEE